MSTRRWAFVLATGATTTALCLSVLAGWQRGGSLPERLVWVATGLVLVASAHLLPALLRDVPMLIRCTGTVLWSACLATACFGHVLFFVTAQQHAGEQRALAVRVTPPSSSRSLTSVMAERAGVAAQLASANARYCAANCVTLEARRVTLTARLDALNAEADDVRRRQADADRVTAQHDALLADPVTSRLAALLGITTARVDLLSGVMFAAVLEAVACLLWTVAFRIPPRTTRPAAAGVTSPVVPTVAPIPAGHADESGSTTGSHVPRDDPAGPLPADVSIDVLLPQLARDVAAGLVRPTVADIRRHLRCSQARATALRRQIARHNVKHNVTA
jgi:hypothetical protein